MSDSEGSMGDISPPKAKPKPKKAKQAIEDIYQKKTQLEHILLRPDTYIGSVEPVTENMWVYDTLETKMKQRSITYVPGLYKIFDEILVNAADNKQRDKKMDCIKISINPDKNEISVWNNGKGIPVEMHKEEKMYVPTMIFGHLLTSSNYNDEEEKVTGGRNGFGAKLCNIFSNKFTVETACKDSKKKFKQTWNNNMTKAGDVKIADSSDDYTRITFQPDLTKFKMTVLDRDIVDLMSRRAYDVAASSGGVKVYLNDKRVPVKNFKDYIDLFVKSKDDDSGTPIKINYEKVSDRWEVGVALSDSGYQQISFVNSIATTKGGRHVDYVTDMMVKQLAEVIKKKNKGGINVKPFQIKNHMWVFVNCLVVNPTFDSQTKENMTLQPKSFGSKCSLSDKFINAVLKSGITEAVLSWAKFKAQSQLEKVGGKKKNKLKGVAKLEDANEAGTRNAHKCTLILTEGDSAKSLAVSGLGVVGRDHYGVFPLRGKMLNVREASHKQILENAEINAIIKILGLQYKKKYTEVDDLKTLRYGKLMIMTDQDQDGSHIKGLLINFLHHNWPDLLRLPFLEEFITPIVKATKKNDSLSFYSVPEFEEWRKNAPNSHQYHIKYYKGLGTSTSKEAKEYFEDMQRHRIKFKHAGNQDDNCIIMAFSKKCVDQRKEWLNNWMGECKRRREMDLPDVYLYEKDTKSISFSDFVNKELVLFSNADNERSIPSMVDGLKPGQRKVLFTCFKRNDKREIKVAQLAGSVAEHSAYHHGEVSLMTTIIGLAQNYVGSNNINLLLPNGQFGTRLQGGKDAASPRYIFTMLNPVTRAMFNAYDEPLLIQQTEDNQKIEPMWYCPIIPMVLVNGADGIGTGWMTKIPNYNPREIVENLKAMIRGEEPSMMKPWYKNFRGTVESVGNQRYVILGEVNIIDDTTIEITELPIGTWTQNYKETVLEVMLHGGEKTPPTIQDFKEYNTDTTVRFVISLTPAQMDKYEREGFHKAFKLTSTITNTSMVLFDELGALCKFEHVNEILQRFYALRVTFYDKRKAYLLGMLRAEAKKLSNQARFIMEKCDGVLTVENKKRRAMIEEMVQRKYDSDPVKTWKMDQVKDYVEEEPEEGEEKNDGGPDFDYLLGMKMWSLTLERKQELLKQRDTKLQEVKDLECKTPAMLWSSDLENLLTVLDTQEQKEQEEGAAELGKKGKMKGPGVKGPGSKKMMLAKETMPSPAGHRVQPMIDPELLKKIEKAVQAKENKGKRTKVKTEAPEDDEIDAMLSNLKPLEERLKNSPEMIEKRLQAKKKEMKQTKLPFKAATKVKKNKEFDSSHSDESGSDVDLDESFGSESAVPRAAPRRAAAAKAKFKFDSDDEFDTDTEARTTANGNHSPDMFNDTPKRTVTAKRIVTNFTSDSDSDVEPSRKKAAPQNLDNSDTLFDKLLSGGGGGTTSSDVYNVDSSPEKHSSPLPPRDVSPVSRSPSPPPAKKAPAKPRAKPASDKPKATKPKADKPKPKPKKRVANSSDESDEDIFEVKKKGGSKKRKSSELSSDEEMDIAPRERVAVGGRARKPISYKFDESEGSDTDF